MSDALNPDEAQTGCEVRFYYFCRINVPSEDVRYETTLQRSAAYKKVVAVAKAARTAGLDARIVTVPVLSGTAPSLSRLGFQTSEVDGVPALSFGAIGYAPLDRIVALGVFSYMTVRALLERAPVLLYNYFPEYTIGAVLARLAGRPVHLDIEDGPRDDEPGVRGYVNRFTFAFLRLVCSKKVLTVSHALAARLALDDFLVIYGASSQPVEAEIVGDLPRLNADANDLRVLLGGTLETGTGLDLFAACCRSLSLAPPPFHPAVRSFTIVITGFGGEDIIRRLSAELQGTWVNIEYQPKVTLVAYETILASCFAALSLKVSGSGIGDTTFPSKVVDIVESGALLISTPGCDIDKIFDSSSALILEPPFSDSLAAAFRTLCVDPFKYVQTASNGRQVGRQVFNEHKVGERLREYFWTGSDEPVRLTE